MKIKEKIKSFLLWTQKYTQTDMIYLAKGGFWLTLGQVISTASSLLLSIAFANLFPKEVYGTYKYILSISGILAIATLPGINTAIIQTVARGYEGSFVTALKTKIRWGLIGGFVSLILSGYYYLHENLILTISFLTAALFLPFMDSFGVYNSLLQGKKLFDISSKYEIISQIIATVSLISVLFYTKSLFLILLTYFFSWTFLRFIFLKLTLKKFPQNTYQDPKVISYGKHLSLIGTIGTIAAYLDRILLFHYLGAVEVAIYSIAIAIPSQIKSILKNIGLLVLPKFSIREIREINNAIKRKVIIFSLALGIIFFIYLLISPFLFWLFFPKYLNALFYSQFYALGLILIPKILFRAFLEAKRRSKELYIFNFSSNIIKIVFLMALIPLFKITGAITAFLCSEIFSYIILIKLYYKSISVNNS